MYGLRIILVLLLAAVYTNAAIAFYKAQAKPAKFVNQKGCYVEDLNKVIPYGDYYPDKSEKSCIKYKCDKDHTTELSTCPLVAVDERCQLVSNEEAQYPDCCPVEICGTIAPEYLTESTEDTDFTTTG